MRLVNSNNKHVPNTQRFGKNTNKPYSKLQKPMVDREADELDKIRKAYRESLTQEKNEKNKRLRTCVYIIPAILALMCLTYGSLYLKVGDYIDMSNLRGIRGSGIVTKKDKFDSSSLSNEMVNSVISGRSLPENTVSSDATNKINSTKVSDYITTPGSFYSKEELSGKVISTKQNHQSKTITSELSEPILIDRDLVIPELNHLQDTMEPISPSDHAVFLHMPKTGGTTTKNILGVCHRKVLASEAGIKRHAQDKEIAVVKGYGDSLFVNIDPTTPDGIKRAFDLGFADAHLADLTVTPKLYQIDNLFKPESKGRVISMFRHPIERATSMLNYLKYAEWEPSYIDEFKTMTLEEYTKSPYVENNFYTRILCNTMEGSLTDDHFKIAVYNLRRKVFVGLLDRLDESIDRFEKLFSWNYNYNPTEQEKCREGYLEKGANVGKTKYVAVPEKGTEGYELLAWQNQYDLKIYDIVLKMFEEQNVLVSSKAVEYRLVDTTCSLCEVKKEKRTHAEENAAITFNLDADAKADA